MPVRVHFVRNLPGGEGAGTRWPTADTELLVLPWLSSSPRACGAPLEVDAAFDGPGLSTKPPILPIAAGRHPVSNAGLTDGWASAVTKWTAVDAKVEAMVTASASTGAIATGAGSVTTVSGPRASVVPGRGDRDVLIGPHRRRSGGKRQLVGASGYRRGADRDGLCRPTPIRWALQPRCDVGRAGSAPDWAA